MELGLLLVAFAALAVMVAIFVFVPLARGQATRGAPRESFARAVYRDQLKELERDRERGVIDDDQVAAARREIERRLLAADQPAPASVTRPRPMLAALLAIGVVVIAGGFYAWKGRPGLPDLPYAARGAERMAAAAPRMPRDLDKAVAMLETRLKANPKDLDGWLLLGRTEAVRQHWQKSAEAMRHAMTLAPNRSDLKVAYAEVQVMADGGFVLKPAADAFRAALASEPDNPRALWYLGLEAVQHREVAVARGYWQRLLAALPAGSAARKTVADALQVLDRAEKTGVTPPR